MSRKRKGKEFQLRSTPVTWGIPFDEVIFSKFMIQFMINSGQVPWDEFVSSSGTLVQIARNRIHKKFLKESNTGYLMMLDSDIMFPPKMVDTLMSHHLPIVGGWYRSKSSDEKHPAIYDFGYQGNDGVNHWKHREKPGQGLEKVDGMGAGCWLMRRDVAEALGEEPYDMNAGGEDLVLCRKLHDLNIPLYVDWSVNCAHLGVFYV